MYCWYLRNTYLENNLVKPGKVTVCGEKVDLGRIDAPAYVYASREDHIVPWDGAYRNTQVLPAPRASALRAGRVGPHRRRDQPAGQGQAQPLDRQRHSLPAEAEDWFDKAHRNVPAAGGPTGPTGSRRTPASRSPRPRATGNRSYKAIEPAPGRYVKQKA